MTAEDKLAAYSREYDVNRQSYADLIKEYRKAHRLAAESEATHKSKRSQAILRYKATGDRMSQAEAETRADADEMVASLNLKKLVTRADADAYHQDCYRMSEDMRGLRSLVDAIAVLVRLEQSADRFHASGYTGAA